MCDVRGKETKIERGVEIDEDREGDIERESKTKRGVGREREVKTSDMEREKE